MIAAGTIDALNRIAERAQDVMRAYETGGFGLRNDVNLGGRAPQRAADPLSVAAPPNSYFVTQGADGARAFTRDGGFRLEGGMLRTAAGAAVLGFAGGDARGAVATPIALPVRDVALGRPSNVRVESDGSVAYTRSVIDPRTAERSIERVVAGKIALARFPAGTSPVMLDATRVTSPPGIAPHLGTPADGTFGGILTYTRDAGAIDIDTSLDKLAEAYRAFSALHAAHSARGGVDKAAMDLVK